MINGLGVCSGIGAMDLGLRLALGRQYRTVGHIERDAYAAAVLVARMEEQALDPAPIWDCVSTFQGASWRGCVDIITAGFPCQPFSASGKRKGLADPRWIWADIDRILEEVRPTVVFIENVPGLAHHGLIDVLTSLDRLGFDAEWDCFSAEDVEAPHKRDRLWLLAADPRRGVQGWLQPEPVLRGHAAADADDGAAAGVLSDPAGQRLLHGAGAAGDQAGAEWVGGAPAHRCAGDPPGARREGEGVSGSQPGQPGWWSPPPGVPLLAYGAATNVDRLRCSGNSCLPSVAALAFVSLFQRLVAS